MVLFLNIEPNKQNGNLGNLDATIVTIAVKSIRHQNGQFSQLCLHKYSTAQLYFINIFTFKFFHYLI